MTMPGEHIFTQIGLSDLEHICAAEIEAVQFYKSDKRMEIVLSTSSILPAGEYFEAVRRITKCCGCKTVLLVHAAIAKIRPNEFEQYIRNFARQDRNLCVFTESSIRFEDSESKVIFEFLDNDKSLAARELLEPLANRFKTVGANDLRFACEVFEMKPVKVETVQAQAPVQSLEVKPEVNKKTPYRKKKENWEVVQLKDVHDPVESIQFSGELFACDERITKTGRMIKILSVYDGTDAMQVKCIEGRLFPREELTALKEGMRIQVYGNVIYDTFMNDLVINAVSITALEKKSNTDNAEEKRIELHMHTNMSEMDAVCDAPSCVAYAYSLGHEGICITDHGDVQSFVKAYNAAQSVKKKGDRPFRVGLGCEMNMAEDQLTIVRNATDDALRDVGYVCFDLETTGLSCYYDSIIEFGAVKVRNNNVVDKLQMFIKPPHPIPPFITAKTKITNEMVEKAGTFEQVIDQILEWIGDDVLVAHNATFDYFFLNEELRRIHRPALTNPVIDTLDLSRAVLKDRHYYRLGNVANFYRIQYDEDVAHRADYDAEVLNNVFEFLLRDAMNMGAVTLEDLQEKVQDEDAYRKVRRSHVMILARNHDGLKRLYQLVTESCTDTLAVMGKGLAEPRIRRSFIDADRSNLLIGTSCLNNEVFELACNGDDARLRKAMSWYDYVEIQPLSVYGTSIALGSIPSKDRLKLVLKRIIDMARQLGKPVVADSDAHYLTPDQKIFRDVYIMSQGVGGVTHPLYIRDAALRQKTKSPDQHLRLTNEMMEEFEWLDDPQLVHELVIENPHKVFDMIEEVRPVPAGTFAPTIEGSDDKLRSICNETMMRTYGFEGKIPELVSERLNQELDNIIKHGFGVHYYIAHLLVKKSNQDGYIVGSRGSVGSSFTATMSGITEVNPLPPHYLCPNCHYSEFMDDVAVKSGFDLEDKVCPHCGTVMKGNGHNIPFQTFLGFNADKTPDIDLNFSNEYQAKAHAFIKEVFGEQHAYRAGTIGTVAEKTAYGYVSGYCEKMGITGMRKSMKDYLAKHCQNVKRTTGQHPGGIIIIPEEYIAEDFTPVQYPANDPASEWKTTHYDFHDIHDQVLKFDILGHVDPTAMRLLQNISKHAPTTLPMNDPEVLSLFYEDRALKADPKNYSQPTGALGLPEFGTKTTRKVLVETRPHCFSDLVIISGLSHGTDVWAGNAQTLVQEGHPLSEVIGCRDDIMTYLMDMGLEPLNAFKIMEGVRKGKGLSEEQEADMKKHNVPEWYIGSCKKIKYMFPKAHAVAYCMMAVRIAWYKVHEPQNFYIQYFSLRCDAYEIETMCKGISAVRERMEVIGNKIANRDSSLSNKEKSLYDTLEVCEEMYARGYRMSNIDLYKSKASAFTTDPKDEHVIIPPFTILDGLGDNVARSIEEARKQGEFLSKEDILKRTQLSETLLKKLDTLGCLEGLQDTNQMSLF